MRTKKNETMNINAQTKKIKPASSDSNKKSVKDQAKKKKRTSADPKKISEKPEALFLLPAGTKFNDIYMDASDVAFELKISKRLVRNMRASGKLSYTNPFGKIWYLRQEIAEILEINKKPRRI